MYTRYITVHMHINQTLLPPGEKRGQIYGRGWNVNVWIYLDAFHTYHDEN